MLTFKFSGADGVMTVAETLTSGMVGKQVKLEFTSDWDNLKKTAVFEASDISEAVYNVGNTVAIPAAVLAIARRRLKIGIYGEDTEGNITPTIYAIGPRIEEGADPYRASGDPPMPKWKELEERIEDLEKGTTGGGSGSDSGQNPYELPIATAETLGGVMPVAKTEDMTQPVGVDENGQLYTAPGSGGSDYTLPVGGAELGGVKNGGNVTINEDGTMTAPESEVTDEQVATAVSDWLEANPDKVTTLQDGAVSKVKLADDLLAELGLEPNHNLTEERVEWGFANWQTDVTWIEPTTSQSNQMITPLIRMPQYLKIVNNTGGGFNFKRVRITDSGDYNTAVEQTHNRESGWMFDYVADGETLIIPTNECGDGNRAYLQLLANWTYNTAQEKLEIYAIYDTYRRVCEKPNDDGIFLKDLPMRWVVQGYLNNSQAHLYCVVPYYPECTYSIKGGAYINTNVNYVDAHCLFDDAIFDGYEAQFVPSGTNPAPIPYLSIKAQQYDNSVNGGADAAYRWAYLTTPSAKEITPKWIAFDMQGGMNTSLDDDGRAAAIQAINDGTERNLYVTRWAEQLPRKIFTQVVKANPSYQSGGTLHRSLYQMSDSPLANAKWVLFGDSLTDNYGGKDYSSEYFASKIAREFGMKLDNRAKSGSNIYAGGSGNYTSVSGIVMLDAYLAEIEAGTTEQADYITVAFGTNTFKTELGTNEDTSETNTSVYGATKYFIEKIREKVPNAVLGFVLSPRQNWGSADPSGARDVDGGRTAIKTVCDEYGVPYIDMSTQSGITVAMLPDGIHISSNQSQKLYYHAMRRFMMGL